jgi:hypothetical protein
MFYLQHLRVSSGITLLLSALQKLLLIMIISRDKNIMEDGFQGVRTILAE